MFRLLKKKVRSYRERKKYVKIIVIFVLWYFIGDIKCFYLFKKKKNNLGYIYEFIWLRDVYFLRLRILEKSVISNLELINFLNGELYS